ncbi:MAG: carbohydrate ABC transporter permease [Treponema sp.]|jgi:multiple sugar transport system permease protein|nr:carbohydrate ABC transporter permease [Treponema sp.]
MKATIRPPAGDSENRRNGGVLLKERALSTVIKLRYPQIFIYIFLIFTAFIALFPVIYILLSSFKSNQEIMVGGVKLLPETWQAANYVKAWKLGNFARYTFNSIYMCFFIVIGCICTAAVEGYVFSRGTSPFTRFVYSLVMASLFISIGTLSLFPQMGVIRAVKLNGTLWGVVLVHVFGLNVTQVFLSTSFFNQIPKEIDEAARIDGCGFARIFISIIAPLTQPLIAAIGLISFRLAWSDYLMPYVFTISRPQNFPLVVGVINLKSSGEAASSWDLALAGISISLIPMLIVYMFLNRFFISGLTEGALKG